MELLIRKMKEEDLRSVASLEAQIFSRPWSEGGFRASLYSRDTLYLIAWYGEKLAGYCGLLQSLEEADITNVAVAPAWRRQGVARRMLEELLRQGALRGILRYTLEVREGNLAARRLYESLGFVSAGIRPGFYDLPPENAVIMWRA